MSDDAAITLPQLCKRIGVSYDVVREWDWLPMIGRKIFYDDFILARRQHLGLESSQHTNGHLPKSTADKSD